MAAALLAVAVVAAPLLCGSSRPWAIAALLGIVTAAWIASSRGRRAFRLDPVVVGLLVLAGATVLQAIPLPGGWVEAVSPASHAIQRGALGPLGAHDGAATISLAPAATWLELAKLSLVLLTFAVARDVAEVRSLAAVAAMVGAAGAATAVSGLAHATAGAEAVWGIVRPEGVERVAGPFVNGNHQAGLLALGAAVAVGLSVEAPSSRRRWVWAAVVVTAAVAGVLARSRGGSVAIGMATAGALVMGTATGRARRVFPAAALLALAATVALWGDVLIEVFSDRNTLKVDLWRPAPGYFRDFWATGAGRGAFQVVYPLYQRLPDARTFTHIENGVLQWALDLGVLGVVAALAASVGLAALAWRRAGGAVERGAVVGMAALALHNLVDFNLEVSGVAVPAAALIGSLLARGRRDAPAPARRVPRGVLLGVALLGGAALAWGVGGDMARAEARVREASRTADDARFAAVLGGALRDHPADYLLPLIAAERELRRAASGREASPMPWINRALVLFPGSHEAHLIAARALGLAGRDAQAVLEYRLAIDARPSRAEALIHEMARRWPRFDRLREVARTPADRITRWNLVAVSLDRPATRAQADVADQALLAEQPRHGGALARRAWRALAQGRDRDALAGARALEVVDAAQASRVRAAVWLRNGRPAEAVLELERSAGRYAGDRDTWMDLANAAAAAGDAPRARAAIDRARLAAAGGRQDASVEIAAGAVFERLGDPGAALRAFETASRLAPGRTDAWQGLLRTAERAQRRDLAARAAKALAESGSGAGDR